jgi:RPA family protein
MRERMTAVRASVSDIVNGTFLEDDGARVVSPFGVELRRVVLVGYIINRQSTQGNYASITIDDGTETIKAKAWGTEASSLDEVNNNMLVLLVGKVREYEGEVYIVPEIVSEVNDPNFMILHLLERYKTMLTQGGLSIPTPTTLEESVIESSIDDSESSEKKATPKGALAKTILQYIKENSDPQGVSIQDIVDNIKGNYSKEKIQMEVIELMAADQIQEIKIGRYQIAK